MFHQDYTILNPAGSAVWFCITVPLSPVFLIKYGRMDIYDNPWIYLVDEHGKKKRYKAKHSKADWEDTLEMSP